MSLEYGEPTPRTDAVDVSGYVTADFARQLERELGQAEQHIRQQELLVEEVTRLRVQVAQLVNAGEEVVKELLAHEVRDAASYSALLGWVEVNQSRRAKT